LSFRVSLLFLLFAEDFGVKEEFAVELVPGFALLHALHEALGKVSETVFVL